MYREQLEYFALAYRLGSFSAAAKRVPMSPQGIAKSVRSLEGELGVTLFEAAANLASEAPFRDSPDSNVWGRARSVKSAGKNKSVAQPIFVY